MTNFQSKHVALLENKRDCADVYCVTLTELQAHRDAFIQNYSELINRKDKRKDKCVPVHVMKTYRERRGKAPIILTSALFGGQWSTAFGSHLTRRKKLDIH